MCDVWLVSLNVIAQVFASWSEVIVVIVLLKPVQPLNQIKVHIFGSVCLPYSLILYISSYDIECH